MFNTKTEQKGDRDNDPKAIQQLSVPSPTNKQSDLIRKMLDLQHQYNNCTTISHMRVGPTLWSPSSCEELLCSCCDGVVQ
jgi:hypothetical protein